MTVYHQMGHDSRNLLYVSELAGYNGAILSPVNYDEDETQAIVASYDNNQGFEFIFDPQLYYPRTQRGVLRNWSYFPSDVDTVDYSSIPWWESVCDSLAATVDRLRPAAICSPVVAPRSYDNDYFNLMSQVTHTLMNKTGSLGIDVIQTILVNLSDLANYDYTMTIASILTRAPTKRAYLVIRNDTDPRRELADPEELKGAMLLISTLENNGIRVIVSHCSSDIILWKEAKASAGATGKFFNLRRFTRSRWDESDSGGGQQPYWFEESLLAFLRASDITRMERIGLISPTSRGNPFADQILSSVGQGTSWLGHSWRYYLYWFMNVEARLSSGTLQAMQLLQEADKNWGTVETQRVFLEERRNNGDWIRQWLRAISEYRTPW